MMALVIPVRQGFRLCNAHKLGVSIKRLIDDLICEVNDWYWLFAGGKVKAARQGFERRTKSKVDEARDILKNIIVCHVEVERYNFTHKV